MSNFPLGEQKWPEKPLVIIFGIWTVLLLIMAKISYAAGDELHGGGGLLFAILTASLVFMYSKRWYERYKAYKNKPS
ncbi:MAG: hypothetical protein A3A97_02590 [Candidatus Terrybacteria bacterium RIFCSPLOWO2_01_FULL_40_23]|uniref:Uncharacterized protein n=1 Tax=Candidatus Terrybacteria bacterium RIFCSPLOWO2_01_FULL_40_23 TaxID=1802366 RepID=A0A1G2PVH1_9BACT|nr:MAG: hypothetical protein A3A97_02590 [Candidatus Terrybacteria bacterium RIFCSPLOWO2_01_FULL_40_23]